MGLPAQYRIDAEPVYVCTTDTCWDQDKIQAARDALGEGEFLDLDKWWAGLSRYDAQAMPSQYMREGEEPVRFRLRRLPYGEWAHVKGIHDDNPLLGNYEAFRLGLKSIDGVRIDDVVFPGSDRRKRLSQSDVELILGVIPRHMAEEVGAAVIRANKDLTPIEKKA